MCFVGLKFYVVCLFRYMWFMDLMSCVFLILCLACVSKYLWVVFQCLLCVFFISCGSFVLHLHIFISYFPLFVVDVLCFQFVVVNALSLGMWVPKE